MSEFHLLTIPSDRLSAEEEKELARRAQSGDLAARNRMVECNLRLVMKETRRYRARFEDLGDMFQEGVLGLIHAVGKFDYTRGYRFSTYALFWIRQSMNRGTRPCMHAVTFGSHAIEYEKRIRAAIAQLQSQSEKVSLVRLAELTNLSEEVTFSVLRWLRDTISLDAFIDEKHEATYADFLVAPEDTSKPDQAGILERCIAALTEREREVVQLRYNLGDQEDKELLLREVGERLGVSRARAQQLEKSAFTRMRAVCGIK